MTQPWVGRQRDLQGIKDAAGANGEGHGLGRELGDAGGPLLVGSLAMLAGLPLGLGALTLLLIAASGPYLSKNPHRSS